jgi:dihydroneopterin triphosphate diphosphatase
MNPSQIGCIVFRQKENQREFLLLKRIPEKTGFWQSITGEVENETLLEAVFREAKEEAGIEKKDIIKIIKNINSFEYENLKKNCIVTEYVFGLEIKFNSKITLDKNIYKEHAEFRWVSFEEAMNLLKWESNKLSLQKLNQILEK